MAEASRSMWTNPKQVAEQAGWVRNGRDRIGRPAGEQRITEVQAALAEAFARIARRRF